MENFILSLCFFHFSPRNITALDYKTFLLHVSRAKYGTLEWLCVVCARGRLRGRKSQPQNHKAHSSSPPPVPRPPTVVVHPQKLCASIYPTFQASPTYEQLCDELTACARSPVRAPLAAADKAHDTATLDVGAVAVAVGDDVPPAAPTATNADNAAAGGLNGYAGGDAERIAWPPPRQLGPHGKPESPFAFLGNSPERRRNTHMRRSTAPGLGGGGSGDFDPRAEALAFRQAGCKVGQIETPTSLSGPDLRTLWEASRGLVLEKVMRKIELPSHISRHRPPLGGEGAGGGTPGGRRLSRSGSGATLGSGMSDCCSVMWSICFLSYRERRSPQKYVVFFLQDDLAQHLTGVDGQRFEDYVLACMVF